MTEYKEHQAVTRVIANKGFRGMRRFPDRYKVFTCLDRTSLVLPYWP